MIKRPDALATIHTECKTTEKTEDIQFNRMAETAKPMAKTTT